jgi:predicted aspartyl protease
MARSSMEKIDITAIDTLREDGPLVPVTINGVDTLGLIDTGAKVTCISPALARRISPKIIGSTTMRGIECPIYSVQLVIEGVRMEEEEEVYEFPHIVGKADVLIGRDVLMRFEFYYDGNRGKFRLIS